MNREDNWNNPSHEFHTHRSERYRHPERESGYRFDDYGASARGGYGNESHTGTWGNQGNEMGGSRNTSNQGMYGTYSSSRNYGNMGSYGGAQGYGDSRGGWHPSDREHEFYSGRGNRGQRSYGYQSDYDSHGSTFRNDSDSDLYGSKTSRRFQGTSQGRYDFDRDNYNQGSGSFRGSDSNRNRGYSGRSDYGGSSYNYGSSDGSYMGSGYNRTSQSDYDTGNYGSMGSYSRGNQSSSYNDPYDMRSDMGSFSGSRGPSYPNETYARDTDNTRIQHRDSDYDYDPDHSFNERRRGSYMGSHNRSRTWDRSHDRDFDRY